MKLSKTVKISRSQIVRVFEKKLTTENKKMANIEKKIGKKSRKIKKRAFFIFLSIIEYFKPDETVHNCKKSKSQIVRVCVKNK